MKVLKDKQGNQFIKIKNTLCKLFYNKKNKLFSTWYEEMIIWLTPTGKIIKKYPVANLIRAYSFDNCKNSSFYLDNNRSCDLCPSIAICQCSLNLQRFIPKKKEVNT